MPINFYSALAGIIMKHKLLSSDDCFKEDYPEDRKKLIIDICACIASGIVSKLLPMII